MKSFPSTSRPKKTQRTLRIRTCSRKSHIQPDSLAGFIQNNHASESPSEPPNPYEITPTLPRLDPIESHDIVARALGLPTKRGKDGWISMGDGMFYAEFVPKEHR